MGKILRTARQGSFLAATVLLLVTSCVPVQVGEVPPDGSGAEGSYRPPRIAMLQAGASYVHPGGETWVECTVSGPDDNLTFEWAATGGGFSSPPGGRMTWVAPDRNGDWMISVTVTDSVGNSSTEWVRIITADNLPPIVRSVRAADSGVITGESTLITCVADDPEGDLLTYSWSAEAGEITGSGPSVTWFSPELAPGQAAAYAVEVAVDDGYGGLTRAEVVITVEVPDSIKVFTPLPGWSGTASTDGTTSDRISRAGDDSDNNGYRAYWTFDLSEVQGASVASAKLQFTTAFISASQQALDLDNPFNEPRGLGPLHVYQVRAARDGLPPVYDPVWMSELTDVGLWQPPDEVDATAVVKAIADGAWDSEYLQAMAAFERDTNTNMFGEYITWSDVVLRVYFKGV